MTLSLFGFLLMGCTHTAHVQHRFGSLSLEDPYSEEARLTTQRLYEQYRRIQHIHWQLTRANTALCSRTRYSAGWIISDKWDWPPDLRPAAQYLFGLDQKIQILDVFPDSPSAKAGLQPGDVILAVDHVFADVRRLSAPQVLSRLIQRAENHGHFHLTIKRGDYIAERSVSLEPVCESRAVLVTSLQLGVSVQSHQVHITRGTLTYFDDDDFLAFLMGHAMAHIHLDHDYQSTRNQLAGTLAGFVIDSALFAGGINTGGLFTETGYATGREVYSDRRERQANHYGAYFAARAGYDLSALDQWGARYASEPSESFIPGNSHRLSLSQLESLDLVRDHIARQRAQGLDLSPHHMSAPDL